MNIEHNVHCMLSIIVLHCLSYIIYYNTLKRIFRFIYKRWCAIMTIRAPQTIATHFTKHHAPNGKRYLDECMFTRHSRTQNINDKIEFEALKLIIIIIARAFNDDRRYHRINRHAKKKNSQNVTKYFLSFFLLSEFVQSSENSFL